LAKRGTYGKKGGGKFERQSKIRKEVARLTGITGKKGHVRGNIEG